MEEDTTLALRTWGCEEGVDVGPGWGRAAREEAQVRRLGRASDSAACLFWEETLSSFQKGMLGSGVGAGGKGGSPRALRKSQ